MKKPVGTLYCVATSHLDTAWIWDVRMTIDHFIPATVRDNVARIERCPNYIFSFEGSFHYALIKEYWPQEWRQLKECVKQGRWAVAGSFVNACDVNIPAPESLVRQILYGNAFFRRELATESADILLPDCFGFGYALPSIAAHCGLKGFSTQKLTWGAALTPPPFDIGFWVGPDGNGIVAALQAGNYTSFNEPGLEANADWIRRIESNKAASGLAIAYRYFGTGDRGGAPTEESCLNLEAAIEAGAPMRVKCIRSDALATGMTKEQVAKLPKYRGELLMTAHGAGCYTSQAALKRLNRANERMAALAERAAVGAHWYGAARYPRMALTEAWTGFLWHQFHDDLTGTGFPATYPFSWNDHAVSWNRFATVLVDSVDGMARRLDTGSVKGTAVVVHNPLEYRREEVVEFCLRTKEPTPHVRVFGPEGEVPAQIVGRGDDGVVVAFLAKVPATGVALFDVRSSDKPGTFKTGLSIGERAIENARYRVTVDDSGDIASVFDKSLERELLSAPHGLETRPNASPSWPAWEILHGAVSAPARSRAGGAPAAIRVAESGPVRVALEVVRHIEGSSIVQRISLDAGLTAARVEVRTDVDWQSRDALLKAVFPLAADAPGATYDLGCGTIERGVNTPSLYEVPAQRWADVTNADGKFGVVLMSDCKYGWDRPDTRTLRLTLLHTPGQSKDDFKMQEELDLGRHRFRYAIAGHAGDWRAGKVWRQAASFDQPLTAVQVPARSGGKLREFGLVEVLHDGVGLQALKLAETGDAWVLRLDEKAGRGIKSVKVALAGKVESVRELDGQERELRTLPKPSGTELKLDFSPYQIRTLAVRVAPPDDKSAPYASRGVWLKEPLSLQVTSRDGFAAPGPGFDDGHFIPSESLPFRVYDGPACYSIQNRAGLGAPEAMVCRGGILSLGKKPVAGASLWILAAADGADALGRFGVGDRVVEVLVRRGGGFIGQWDRRSHPSYENSTLVGGRTAPIEGGPAFYKSGRVAWMASHRHDAHGRNKAWDPCFLHSYRIPLPDGLGEIALPNDERIRILGMAIVEDGGKEAPIASLENPFALRPPNAVGE